MRKRNKIFLFAGGAVILLVIIVINLRSAGAKVAKVQTQKVERIDITSIVTANGKIDAKTNVKISANIMAKIIRLPVKEGDFVKKGQLLVQLDPARYKAAVEQYTAGLASARAQMRLAQANFEQARQVFERTQRLFEKNLASQEQFDATSTNLNVARAQLDAAQHQVEQTSAALAQSQDDLEKTTITSPIDGIVTNLQAEEGEVVVTGTMNNPGTVIMNVADLSKIEVKANVDETDISRVKLNQPVKISIDAYPDTAFKGRVTEIGNTATYKGLGTQDQVTEFVIKVLLEEKVPNIKPGMTATVDITTDSRQNVLAIPIQAIVMRPEKDTTETKKSGSLEAVANPASATDPRPVKLKKREIQGVFVVKDGKAQFVKVTTGIADQQNLEITSGLKEKDEVIIGSYKILRTLEDKDRVKVENIFEKAKEKKV